MADTTTRPGVDRRPLIAHLQVQRNTDREMMAILRASAANIDTELKRLATRTGIGNAVRVEQLRMTQAAINREMAVMWTRLGDTIAAGKAEAAAAAVTGMLNPDLLKSVLPPGDLAYLTRSAELSAMQGMSAAEARLRYSQIPLAESVYKNEALSTGKIDDIVNNALARGASAAELARDVRAYVNPNTPGGVRYASQRLGRTELNNSFHASQIRQAQKEPWVSAVKWEISGSHPTPDECDDYAEGVFMVGGNPGEWRPEDVPQKPHPNCLCFTTPVAMDRDAFINGFMKGDFDSYLEEEFGPFEMPAISPNRALHQYAWGKGSNDSGLMYIEINDALRTGKALAPEARQVAAGIDKAFDLTEPLASGSRVYRQIPGQDRELVDRMLDTARKGGTFVDEGYMSTTKSLDILDDFDIEGTGIRLNIQTPAGSKVVRMDDFLDANDPSVFSQDEYLLPRGTKLRLSQPRSDGRGGWVVDAEIESDAITKARAATRQAKPPAPKVATPVETAQARVDVAMRKYKTTVGPAKDRAWSNLQAARAELKTAQLKAAKAPKPPAPKPTPAPAPAAPVADTATRSVDTVAKTRAKTHVDRVVAPGMDKRVAEELKNQAEIVPHTTRTLQKVRKPNGTPTENAHFDGGTWAVHKRDQIVIRDEVFKPAAQRSFKHDCATGWHPEGLTDRASHVVAHEFGHQVDSVMKLAGAQERGKLLDAIAKELGMSPRKPYASGYGSFPEQQASLAWTQANAAILRAKVSKYGATNELEMLAEIWAEYSTSPTPRPHILRIGRLMQELAERTAERRNPAWR